MCNHDIVCALCYRLMGSNSVHSTRQGVGLHAQPHTPQMGVRLLVQDGAVDLIKQNYDITFFLMTPQLVYNFCASKFNLFRSARADSSTFQLFPVIRGLHIRNSQVSKKSLSSQTLESRVSREDVLFLPLQVHHYWRHRCVLGVL